MGHRGAGFCALAENTMHALNTALKLGLDMVEVDVALTKDEEVIMFHVTDGTNDLNQCSTGQGDIEQTTWAELSNVQVYEQPIPRLSDMLQLCETTNLTFQIELKHGTDYRLGTTCFGEPGHQDCVRALLGQTPRLLQRTVDIIRASKCRPEQILVSSFQGWHLPHVAKLLPEFPHRVLLVALQENHTKENVSHACHVFNATHVSISAPKVSAELVQHLGESGLTLEAGMPGGAQCFHKIPKPERVGKGDDADAWRRAIAIGAPIIITNHPGGLLRELGRYSGDVCPD